MTESFAVIKMNVLNISLSENDTFRCEKTENEFFEVGRTADDGREFLLVDIECQRKLSCNIVALIYKCTVLILDNWLIESNILVQKKRPLYMIIIHE